MDRAQRNGLKVSRVGLGSFTRSLAGTALALAIAAAPAAFAEDSGEGRDLGPGCAPDRPAVPHHAGGVFANPGREKPPLPCVTTTGWRTSEISIAVTNAGTVLFEPAIAAFGRPVGALRSVDRGASWEFIDPGGDPPRIGAIDMNISVDRRTGRVFWSNDLELPVGYLHNQLVDYSDDDGKTWFASSPLPMHYDHTQIFSGPRPQNARHREQERNVVYTSVSGGFTCPAYQFCGAHVSKSLDGGATWGQAVAIPYPTECPAPGSAPVGGYGLKGVVGRDGTVYLPFTPCVRPYVAISHDEGNTWQLALVANTQTIGWGELGLD